MKTVLTAEQVQDATRRVAEALKKYYGQEPVTAIAVMNGAAFFAVDLLRQLPENFIFETVRVRSYIGTSSSGKLEYLSAMPEVQGKNVLLLDEICDSGLTLFQLMKEVYNHGAATCRTAVLLCNQSAHESVAHTPHFIGHDFSTDPGFLIGSGMDMNGKLRQLSDVRVL